MTVIEYAPTEEEILDFVNDSIRQMQEAAFEPKYSLLGPEAYTSMQQAMGKRFNRDAGTFETYQFFPIVVDPLRKDTVCVLPAPAHCVNDISVQRVS